MDSTAKIAKWSVMSLMTAWLIGAGWSQFVPLVPDEIKSQQAEIRFQDRLKQCTGSYNERYTCKSDLFRERDTATFIPWAKAAAVVFLPLILVYSIYSIWARFRTRLRHAALQETTLQRRREIREEEEKRREETRIIEQERLRVRNIEAKRRGEISRIDDNARAEGKEPPVHVLLIPEDTNQTQALTEALEARDCHVIASTDIEDGLIGIDKLRYDVAVIGILTGGPGGIDGIKKIKDCRNDIKIIALTAGSAAISAGDILRAAKTLGADGTFSHPVDPAELGKLVQKLAATKPSV
ncbi:MAG: response regulator [Rhodospirillales bacterium]